MPRHSNAIGYLTDLRDQESLPWLSWICDNAISSNGRALQKDEIILLIEILLGEKPYTPISASPITTTTSTTQPPGAFVPSHLKEIYEFSNFKSLSPDLKLIFDKPVTLIFGCNGSGKTSLCEAIKILSSPENPQNPLTNVKEQTTTPCTFKYQFNAEPGPNQWEISQGYGVYSNRIKYFDSSIAVQHISGSAEPERIVRIEPFRLEIFSYAGKYVRQLNDELINWISKGRRDIDPKIELLKTKFEKFISIGEDAINNMTSTNCKEIETVLKNHAPIDSAAETKYIDNRKTLESMVKARGKEGLKLQQTECDFLLQ